MAIHDITTAKRPKLRDQIQTFVDAPKQAAQIALVALGVGLVALLIAVVAAVRH